MSSAVLERESRVVAAETPAPPVPPTPSRPTRWSAGRIGTLLTVLVVLGGVGLRLVPALGSRSVIYPDETYQMTEAAHRVVFGYGIVPWEFSVGTRSWLGPGLLLPPVLLWRRLGLDGVDGLGLVRAWVAILAGLGAGSAALLGRRLAGRAAGLLAAGFVAFAPLSIVYEVHPLADTVAAPLTLTALALLTVHRRTAVAAAGAGVLLVAAVVLRPQLLPVALAVVVAVLAVAWRGAGWGRARWLAVGVGVGAAAAGLLDTLTWGTPFAPLWRTFTFNIVDDGASRYGRSPWSTYLTAVWHVDGPVLTVLLVGGLLLACRPRRGDPFAIGIVVGGVVVFVAVLSLIGHKELRFLVPMLPVAGALAGVGLARGLRALLSAGRAWASALRAGVAIAGATAAVTTTGLLVVPGITMSDLGYAQWPDSVWTARDATPRLLSAAGALPGTCGVALVKSWLSWSGGYSALHRDVPLGYTTRPYDLRTWQRWANVVVARTSVKLPAGYRRLAVRGDFVLAQRPGGCAVPPAGVPQRTI